ncbi:EI24 domain-containing protein [Roseomonas gilardii]|uniref:Cysteine biosynthesis protein CysZ n=1 Tax=Roseomonas gilardii TaxID=257708 RepID=A0A1L7ADH2_9PROT|nr:EI24 domain-containing protein [Roseomonas gilardii]APT56791.1 cysteine biosynthesis protein CysZ [Roseomonas gilardii]MDT8329626.1 EI24 domain-containing protein [Roseomonas gilardii]PZR11352.1 MAG: cysteine biosynthesis protein CysZ [Azospirillum brasilense]
MTAVLASLFLPFRQLGDPDFRGPLLKGLLGAMVSFALLVWLADWGIAAMAGHFAGEGWIATLAGLLGVLLVLFCSVWLFVPVVLAIAGLFTDQVAAAVEHRFYPWLPPPAGGASLAAQARFNLRLTLQVLVLNLILLPLSFALPVVGTVLLWVVAAVALGNGLFEGVAQRRMTVPEARLLRRRRRAEVFLLGAVLAALAVVPVANLLVPILGTAAMTHLLHRGQGALVPRPQVAELRAG